VQKCAMNLTEPIRAGDPVDNPRVTAGSTNLPNLWNSAVAAATIPPRTNSPLFYCI
jgi:hypothetical protein